jgi:UDP-N-acetylglucosamine 2-epimerase (non-hydrolysing)
MGHLAQEGLADRAVNVGDVMTDICFQTRDAVTGSAVNLPDALDPDEPYVVATIHRAENTDDGTRLRRIIAALRNLDAPVVLVAHPRLVTRASSLGIELAGGSLHTTTPLAYPQMLRAVLGSAGVVTDSGGLQKEAFLLGIPCTTLRTETEWIETLENGWNILDSELTLVGSVAVRPKPEVSKSQPYGDGMAAARVMTKLRERMSVHGPRFTIGPTTRSDRRPPATGRSAARDRF